MTTGYEQTSVSEIRDILRERWSITNEDILGQTKKPLVELLLELESKEHGLLEEAKEVVQEEELVAEAEAVPEMTEEDTDGMFAAAVEDDDGIVSTDVEGDEDLPIPEAQPPFGTDEWHDYVMRQFREDELFNGNPKCAGCFRLVGRLIGPVIETTVPAHTAPDKNNMGTGTVVVSATVHVLNDTHPACGSTIHMEDIADVNDKNTDAPYSKHQSATAATRAWGRIYRKLLQLPGHIITAEEASEVAESDNPFDEGWVVPEDITSEQMNVIDLICGRKNLNVMELINLGDNQYDSIKTVPKGTAQKMIQYLNAVQRGSVEAPKGIGAYDSDWRNE